MGSRLYEQARLLAREVRAQYEISGPRLTKSHLRGIYKDQGIRVDYWPYPLKHLRGAYFRGDTEASVLIAKSLPTEQQIFTLGHELKHHLADRDLSISFCDLSNEKSVIEISAEIFAAELIFPQELFLELMAKAGVERDGSCSADDIIHLKMSSTTTLSYAGLVKMAEFLSYCERGAFRKVQFRKRQEELYGEPLYKRILRHRNQLPRRRA